jgi:ABC-type multidrug transport system permease subunit
MILSNWLSVSYGLFMSVIFPSFEAGASFSPMITLPLMFLGGFYVNVDTVPWFLRWISYISPFNYGFKAGLLSIFEGEDF